MSGVDKNVIFYTILFYYSASFIPTKCSEFNLRIEYNETANEKATSNPARVTNRTDEITNGKLHLESNFVHAKPNTLTETKQGNLNTHHSNVFTKSEENRNLPYSDSNDIKNKLNNFRMIKRDYYFPTPSFEYPSNNKYLADDLEFRHFKSNNDLRLHNNEFMGDLDKHNKYKDYKSNNFNERENAHFGYAIGYDIDKLNRQNQGFLNLFSNPEMTRILKKQTELIEDLENFLRFEKQPLRTDFDDLLYSVQGKKNITETTPVIERITDTTAILPTVTAVIDATEVRTALKQDPLVQRILKMANKKKERYMKHAKKYYNNLA